MNTRCLACLISIYDLFIVNGVKTIPANISYYLTPLALAVWSMDDGSKAGSGFILILIPIHLLNKLFALRTKSFKK
jgi:hypothetical protein